jgi:hypothetical protein
VKKKSPIRTLLWLTGKLFPFITEPVYEAIYFVQRGLNGWSERDCWSIDWHLDRKLPEMLRWLKENKHGVPNEFVVAAVEERGGIHNHEYGSGYTDKDVDRGAELYNAMLDRIIAGFDAHRLMEENDWDWKNIKELRRKEDECRAIFEEGMKLFVKYYDTFWD